MGVVEPFRGSFRPVRVHSLTGNVGRTEACGSTNRQASQADAQSDSQWRVVQQASSAMTQELQARKEWGWDNMQTSGMHYTPHQGDMRETHVASRKK